MLPKVATHILHSTSRAAASIHSQTHTLRNVLQLQSSGPSGSGSGRGSNAGGPGAKQTGSRFYSYNGAGRAVTQANAVTSIDGEFIQQDEPDEHTPRRALSSKPRTRIRSSSLSTPVNGRRERGEKLGVLRTVQIHTRSRHVFAPNTNVEEQDDSALDTDDLPIDLLDTPRTVLRRNSTSSSDGFESISSTRPTSPALSRRHSTVSHHSPDALREMPPPPPPAQPTPAPEQQQPKVLTPREEIYEALRLASINADRTAVSEALRRLKNEPDWKVQEYNMALQALANTRREGEPLNALLDLYNQMLQSSIMPNVRTYLVLLRVFAERDYEVQRLVTVIEARVKRHELTGRLETTSMAEDLKRLENEKIDLQIYRSLLRSCAHHANVDAAIHVFAQIEKREKHTPDPICYQHLLRAFVASGNLEGAEAVFAEYLSACKEGRVYISDEPSRDHLKTFNQMVEGYFRLGGHFDTPHPASSTYTTVISGFCDAGDHGSVSEGPYVSSAVPIKPDMVAWSVYHVKLRPADRVLHIPKEEALKRLTSAINVLSDDVPSLFQVKALTEIVEGYIAHDALMNIAERAMKKAPESVTLSVVRRAQGSVVKIAEAVYSKATKDQVVPWELALRLAEMHAASYLSAKEAGNVVRLSGKWFVPLLDAAQHMLSGSLRCEAGYTVDVTVEDLSGLEVEVSLMLRKRLAQSLAEGMELGRLNGLVGRGVMLDVVNDAIALARGMEMMKEVEEKKRTERVVQRAEKEKERKKIVIEDSQTKFVELMLMRRGGGVLQAYEALLRGLNRQKAPALNAFGHIIQGLGRLGEMQKVHRLYGIAQELFPTLPVEKQHAAWMAVENSMVIAHAHAGDVDAAHVHRIRMLEQGGAPSADAYGALILHVKDTTDDTSNAMSLYQESQVHGIVPNLYLYNNIISKLAKARKADFSLELFQQMKMNHVQPSSITYGAVIGACARVGDAVSAENLFAEMLYTSTKPNRERALFYFEGMRKVDVQPSAYSYKLMIDAYGALEPIDSEKMEEVFQELRNAPDVKLQGIHFAALINSYGCVQKNVDKAIEVFESIPSYKVPEALDAVVFEAIFNMAAAGVHMTAYIANTLIKGYALWGLMDAPVGVAAPNNHAPHDPEMTQNVSPTAPVYREPSTWEAMIRAELGAGNRAEAEALLERLRTRYAISEAVFNRISGILLDHTMIAP
ncbi:hypothetical protein BDQ17DRAFT_1363957 [Cyathus striatus]|nr:hypothetical protein BDQ17DRAFT_1363957 [Cyathus striatus]